MRGITITVEEVPEPSGLWQQSPPPRLRTDAHHVDGFTPCRVCGGAVGLLGSYVGGWRQHTDCERLSGWPPYRVMEATVALRLLRKGGEVTHTDAQLMRYRVPLYADVHPEPTWTDEKPSRAWGHVDRKALAAALTELPALRVEAGLVPTLCVDGPCAWCGITSSMGWTAHGHKWRDGSPAPLCGACGVVHARHGSPMATAWDETQRIAMGEALTGVPASQGNLPPEGLRGYAQTARSETSGRPTGEPWAHLPREAVEAYRWTEWGRYGGQYAPPEHRAEALTRAAALQAQRVAETAARDAEERSRADVFGFEEK
jgi:hypothetical protein